MKRGRIVAALLTAAAICSTLEAQDRTTAIQRVDFRQVVQDAKDKVFPAVIYIKIVQQTHEYGKKISQEISGGGVIISEDGLALTNHHVIDKATEIRCQLYDGRAMRAKGVGDALDEMGEQI